MRNYFYRKLREYLDLYVVWKTAFLRSIPKEFRISSFSR